MIDSSLLAEQPSRLTPLGTWWANVLLRAAGAVAPVIGELAEPHGSITLLPIVML